MYATSERPADGTGSSTCHRSNVEEDVLRGAGHLGVDLRPREDHVRRNRERDDADAKGDVRDDQLRARLVDRALLALRLALLKLVDVVRPLDAEEGEAADGEHTDASDDERRNDRRLVDRRSLVATTGWRRRRRVLPRISEPHDDRTRLLGGADDDALF